MYVIHCVCIYIYIYMTLNHKTSLKSLGYICSNSQKYILWLKIIDFSFMPKIISISKDHKDHSIKIFSYHKYIKTSFLKGNMYF